MSLTVCCVTARKWPRLEWLMDSLRRQKAPGEDVKILVVDAHCEEPAAGDLALAPPKPTVWQGPHRLTRRDHWAAANARNTGICLCRTDWIAFVDDRSVLVSTWLEAVRDAMAGGYAVVRFSKLIAMVPASRSGIIGPLPL